MEQFSQFSQSSCRDPSRSARQRASREIIVVVSNDGRPPLARAQLMRDPKIALVLGGGAACGGGSSLGSSGMTPSGPFLEARAGCNRTPPAGQH